ncbi:11619_t:CDS:2, partial [Acaulospora morrowiae]
MVLGVISGMFINTDTRLNKEVDIFPPSMFQKSFIPRFLRVWKSEKLQKEKPSALKRPT